MVIRGNSQTFQKCLIFTLHNFLNQHISENGQKVPKCLIIGAGIFFAPSIFAKRPKSAKMPNYWGWNIFVPLFFAKRPKCLIIGAGIFFVPLFFAKRPKSAKMPNYWGWNIFCPIIFRETAKKCHNA